MRAFHNREDGFSLIEAAVALAISVVLFVLLAVSLQASQRSAAGSRTMQEATSIGTQYAELSRGLTWDELAMDAVESGDPRVAGGKLLATVANLPADEDLVVDASGLIDGKVTETVDNTAFTVWQYVTVINSELKRVVIFVEWDNGGHTRVHHASTVVAENRKWTI
jgi:type II secretory pathway pseudopilin PulG